MSDDITLLMAVIGCRYIGYAPLAGWLAGYTPVADEIRHIDGT